MRKAKLIWYLLTIVPILLLIMGYIFPSTFFNSQEQLRDYVSSFGALAPPIFIAISIIQVIVTPISHYTVGFVGGFLFGTWSGFLYNWIGRVIGSAIAFYLGRKFGRKVLQHVVRQETLNKYDWIFNKGKLILFLMYFLPLFPDDELSYLAGFSAMKARDYLPIMLLGHIGGSLALAYVGSGISYKDPLFIGLSIVSLTGGVVWVLLMRRIKYQSSKGQ